MDPRILPDEELARYKADAERAAAWLRAVPDSTPDEAVERILALIENCKALAEQVDTLTRELTASKGLAARYGERHTALVARAEKAEAEAIEQRKRADAYRDTENVLLRAEKARADAAEQRLADRDKAIRDLADEWESGNGGMWHTVRSQFAAALRALLPEE